LFLFAPLRGAPVHEAYASGTERGTRKYTRIKQQSGAPMWAPLFYWVNLAVCFAPYQRKVLAKPKSSARERARSAQPSEKD